MCSSLFLRWPSVCKPLYQVRDVPMISSAWCRMFMFSAMLYEQSSCGPNVREKSLHFRFISSPYRSCCLFKYKRFPRRYCLGAAGRAAMSTLPERECGDHCPEVLRHNYGLVRIALQVQSRCSLASGRGHNPSSFDTLRAGP